MIESIGLGIIARSRYWFKYSSSSFSESTDQWEPEFGCYFTDSKKRIDWMVWLSKSKDLFALLLSKCFCCEAGACWSVPEVLCWVYGAVEEGPTVLATALFNDLVLDCLCELSLLLHYFSREDRLSMRSLPIYCFLSLSRIIWSWLMSLPSSSTSVGRQS